MSEHQKPQSDILSAFQSVIKNCRTARDAQKLTDSSVEFVEPIDHVNELERSNASLLLCNRQGQEVRLLSFAKPRSVSAALSP